LRACPAAIQQLLEAAKAKPHCAGYINACGTTEARDAIAKFHSYPEHVILPDNVIVANGCSGALELALTALLDPQSTLLVPQPGFPLYQVIAESHGASVAHYRLDPENDWEIDMDHLSELMKIHSNVRAIVVNNPSNPTGCVFTESSLVRILEFASKHQLPIVADEVYGELTFGSARFIPLAKMAARLGREVPVITASGLAKQFLLPGWRVGWITFHDK
jgi:tyrosine aminotransferase